MGKCHERFEDALEKIGLAKAELPTAVFYRVPIGIRFAIGGSEEVYLKKGGMNPVYVENALRRAQALLKDLPCSPDLLRIDNCPEESGGNFERMLSQIGLPALDELVWERRDGEGGESFLQEHLYWDLTKHECSMDKLLLEIIKGDICGFSCLCSNVYLLDTKNDVLYHLYDDRGADIAAPDRDLLRPLYRKYGDWVLECDQEIVERRFGRLNDAII